MKTVSIKGKEYVEVHQRILFASESKEFDYDIQTDFQMISELKMWVVKATLNIYKDGNKFTYNGSAQEIIGDGFINKTSALENAETSAVGRAFAMAGIGIVDGIASVDEINKAKNREKDYDAVAQKKEKERVFKFIENAKNIKELQQAERYVSENEEFQKAYEQKKLEFK